MRQRVNCIFILYMLIIIMLMGCKENNSDVLSDVDKYEVLMLDYGTDEIIIKDILIDNKIECTIDAESNIKVKKEDYLKAIYVLGLNGYSVGQFSEAYVVEVLFPLLDIKYSNVTSEMRDIAYDKKLIDNLIRVLEANVFIEIDSIELIYKEKYTVLDDVIYMRIVIKENTDVNYQEIICFLSNIFDENANDLVVFTNIENELVYGKEQTYSIINDIEDE